MATVLRVEIPSQYVADFEGELAPYRVEPARDAQLSRLHIDVPGSDTDLFSEASANVLAFLSHNQAVLQKAKDRGASLVLDFGIFLDGSYASRNLLSSRRFRKLPRILE